MFAYCKPLICNIKQPSKNQRLIDRNQRDNCIRLNVKISVIAEKIIHYP